MSDRKTERTTVALPRPPRAVVADLLEDRDVPTPEYPVAAGQMKANWSMPSSNVMQAAVADHGQAGNEHYAHAHIVITGEHPYVVTRRVFSALADASLQQAADRAGHGDPDALPRHQRLTLLQTAACEAVKRVWTTAMKESSLARSLGTPDSPDTYAEAVERERASEDIRLADGRSFQEKSLAGERDGDLPHIWCDNFEDYFNSSTLTARVEQE